MKTTAASDPATRPLDMATVRRLALSLLRQDENRSVGVKNGRLKAGWDEDYLLQVLQQL